MKKIEQSTTISSVEFLNSLNKYIPSLVLSQWISKADVSKMELPEIQDQETAVLFADISGFTMISEACAQMGVRGNEELAFCINRYMEGMVKSLGKYGGDIIKFVGDAMIVIQSSSNNLLQDDDDPETSDDKVSIIRKAIQCALDIQNELNNKKIMSNVTNLSVKIGIGYGDCALLYVGGVFNRAEYFTIGEALTQALSSEEHATGGGQIIVSHKAFKHVTNFFQAQELESDHGGKFYKILAMTQGIRTRAEAILRRNLAQADTYMKIQGKLKMCVPAAIMPYLEIGYEQFGSETRRLSVMFASLGVDLSSAKSREGMMKIQRIVTTVQQQVYRLEGSLNKLVMDDKGSTLICIWGLSPFAHEDDAARAILTAMNMKRELAKIENTWCNVGISTGEVFSGVVGTSGSRKEFSVLGDFVNLAARIMYWPKKYKQTGKIHVDLQTKKEADNLIKFDYRGHCEFKGKSISLPIFEPTDPQDEAQQCIKEHNVQDCFLKIHSNPFIIDRNQDTLKKVRQIGREQLVRSLTNDITDYFDNQKSSQMSPYFVAILGEVGSGKTLFARTVLEQLRKNKNFSKDGSLGEGFSPILCSSLNCETQMKYLNMWRPILQQMLHLHCKKLNIEPKKLILQMIRRNHSDKLDIICKILNLEKIEIETPQLSQAQDPLFFVKRESYSEEVNESLLEFFIEFIKDVLGEKSERGSDSSYQGFKKLSPQKSNNSVLLVFDNVYFMDDMSWRLLELVKDECTKIGIMLLVQTDTNNQPKILGEAVQTYQEAFGNYLDQIKIIDLPQLSKVELSTLLQSLSRTYQQSMSDEIQLMVRIEDPATTIKNQDKCDQNEREFKKKYQINDYFIQINEELIDLALSRCEGNPLISLSFIFNLLTNDYLTIQNKRLEITQLFKKCQARSDWTGVPVPSITSKINATLLDTFVKEMRSKQNKMDCEASIKGILLLKSASVIGDQFGTKALHHIIPLRNESHKSILNLLKILEQKDFIEILDETDPKNVICRFRKCFLRESIYQIMLYRSQKKGLHQMLSQFIEMNPNILDNDPDQEADKLLMHILKSEDLENEDLIPFKAKQGLIVKKMANKLSKNPNCICKIGNLTKQGNKPNKNITYRYTILTQKDITWYHNEMEYQQKVVPLGVIYLSQTYHCVPANRFLRTADINVKFYFDLNFRLALVLGKRKTKKKKANVNLFLVQKMRMKEMNGQLQQSTLERQNLLSLSQDFGIKIKSSTKFFKAQSPPHPKQRRSSKLAQRFGSITNFQQIQENRDLQITGNPKELASKLKKLYSVNFITFLSQVSQNANKVSHRRQETLSKIPDYLRVSLMNSDVGEVSNSEQNNKGPSKPPSIVSDNSVERFRRVSEIPKREIFEADLEMKKYYEESKNGNNHSVHSPETISKANKISEKSEDSDSEVSQDFQAQRNTLQIQTQKHKSHHQDHLKDPYDQFRLSKQLTMHPKQEREMTFHKDTREGLEEVREDQFQINVSPTKKGQSPSKHHNIMKKSKVDDESKMVIAPFSQNESSESNGSPITIKSKNNLQHQFENIIQKQSNFNDRLKSQDDDQRISQDLSSNSYVENLNALNSQKMQGSILKQQIHQDIPAETLSNLTQTLTQVIKDEVAKGISQMFQQNMSQQLNMSQITNRNQNYSILSDQVQQQKVSGGVGSSKKVIMKAVESKQSNSPNKIREFIRPQQAREEEMIDPEEEDSQYCPQFPQFPNSMNYGHMDSLHMPYCDPYMFNYMNNLSMPEDFFENDIDDIQSQNSVIYNNSSPKAVVIQDCCCQIKGEIFTLYEGDQVEILGVLNVYGVAQCRFQNQEGIFPLDSIKFIKRNQRTKSTFSTQKPYSQQIPTHYVPNSQHQPVFTERNFKNPYSNPHLMIPQHQRKYTANSNMSQQFIPSAQSSFRDPKMQQQQKIQNQRNNFFHERSEAKGSNQSAAQTKQELKLHKRKQERQSRQTVDMSRRLDESD